MLILGNGMVKGSTVTVGGAPLTDLQIASEGTVAAGKLPSGKGTADVVVANPDGTARTLVGAITYS